MKQAKPSAHNMGAELVVVRFDTIKNDALEEQPFERKDLKVRVRERIRIHFFRESRSNHK